VSCVFVVCCVRVSCVCRGRNAVCVCRVVSCVVFVVVHGMWLMLGGVWGSGNELGAEGAAALAGALSKLVNLMSLDLGGTWNAEWVVSCVYVVCCVCVSCGCRGRNAVCVCRVVSCVVFVVAHGMWLMLGAYGDQGISWVPREQQPQWRVR